MTAADKARVIRTPSPNKAVWSTYDHGKDDGAKAERQRIRRAQRGALRELRKLCNVLVIGFEVREALSNVAYAIDTATRATRSPKGNDCKVCGKYHCGCHVSTPGAKGRAPKGKRK